MVLLTHLNNYNEYIFIILFSLTLFIGILPIRKKVEKQYKVCINILINNNNTKYADEIKQSHFLLSDSKKKDEKKYIYIYLLATKHASALPNNSINTSSVICMYNLVAIKIKYSNTKYY